MLLFYTSKPRQTSSVWYNLPMETRLAPLPLDASYGVSVDMLSSYASYFFDDYQISDKRTNYDVFCVRLSKTRVKKLRGDVRRALKFLKSLPDVEAPSFLSFKTWAKKFDSWHKILAAYHVDDYKSDNFTWKYLGTGLHYFIDALYHIFLRFTKVKKPSQTKCKWCGESILISWDALLSQIVFDQLPMAYLYLSFAQAEIDESFSLKEVIEDSFKNVAVLGRSVLLAT